MGALRLAPGCREWHMSHSWCYIANMTTYEATIADGHLLNLLRIQVIAHSGLKAVLDQPRLSVVTGGFV